MPAPRANPPHFGSTVAALAAPAAVALALLWLAGEIHWPAALVGLAIVAAGVAVVARRQLSALAALRARVETMVRARAAGSGATAPADLEVAIAELDRGIATRDAEARNLAAANQAILAAIPDPMILIDTKRAITRANAAARALFGADLEGRALDGVLRHPDVLEAADECAAGSSTAHPIDLPWPGPPERHFSVRLASLPDGADGGAILLVLHDVTALKQAERMRADFVANVSHELRTPLTALLGFTETLRGAARDDAEARERFLGIMHAQAQRMTRLVNDLLSLSRIEESEHTRPTEPVPINRVIGGVADALAIQARNKGVRVALDMDGDLPAVPGDADQLAQVFQNLIDNAIKYSKPQGEVKVSARAAQPPRHLAGEGGDWIAVAVTDAGEGIAREHLPRLTERFYRVDTARSRELGGTGLGLAIVKHVLNRHHGRLSVDSEPGKGSTFTVWLPR